MLRLSHVLEGKFAGILWGHNYWKRMDTQCGSLFQPNKTQVRGRRGLLFTRARWSTMRLRATFSFFIFISILLFSFLFPLCVAPSSSLLFPPCCSFFLVAPSSFLLFPSRCSFLLALSCRHCSFHSESAIIVFSSKLTKALRTDQQTDQSTSALMNRQSFLIRDARMHIKSKSSMIFLSGQYIRILIAFVSSDYNIFVGFIDTNAKGDRVQQLIPERIIKHPEYKFKK